MGRPSMNPVAKLLIVAGLILVAAGLFFLLSEKVPWLGKLPGDITIKREKFSFYFPLATCLIISAILTIILWLFKK